MRLDSWFVGLSVMALVGFSSPASASTDAVKTNSASSTLKLMVTVQKVTLKPVQNAAAAACAAGSDYSMSFGRVGIAARNACGARVEPTSPGGSPSAQYTVLTPAFQNQSVSSVSGTEGSGYIGVTVQPASSGKSTASGWASPMMTHTITAP